MKISLFLQYYKFDKNSERSVETINITKHTQSKDYLSIIKKELNKVGRNYKHIVQAVVTSPSGIPLYIVDSMYDIPMEALDE